MAYQFLNKTAAKKSFQCVAGYDQSLASSTHDFPSEMFSSMVILDLLFDLELNEKIKINIIQMLQAESGEDNLYTCFTNKSLLPSDTDSTSLAYTVLAKTSSINHLNITKALSAVIKNVDATGIIEVYLDPKRHGRIDPVVCANALYFIHLYGRGDEAKPTEEFVYQTLTTENYVDGTLYYPSEDTCLYMISRLLDFPALKKKFAQPLIEKLQKRIGSSNGPLDLAMRIICSKKLGLTHDVEAKKLALMQQADGGWPQWAFFKNGKSKNSYAINNDPLKKPLNEYYGSREIVTAFAIKALTDETALHNQTTTVLDKWATPQQTAEYQALMVNLSTSAERIAGYEACLEELFLLRLKAHSLVLHELFTEK